MAEPLFKPEDFETSDATVRGNAVGLLSDQMRREILPREIEQRTPDFVPVGSGPSAPAAQPPSLWKLVAGGILRQRLGVDIFAGINEKRAQEAREQFLRQTTQGTPIDLDEIAAEIKDPKELELFQRRVAALTPLTRRVIEVGNAFSYGSLPAETLKLLNPGSTDSTNTQMQMLDRIEQQLNVALGMHASNPTPATEEMISKLGEGRDVLLSSLGVEINNVGANAIAADQFGNVIARGVRTTETQFFELPDGSTAGAIPGTPEHRTITAIPGIRPVVQRQVQEIRQLDPIVNRDVQVRTEAAQRGVDRLAIIRRRVFDGKELLRPLRRLGLFPGQVAQFLGGASEETRNELAKLNTLTAGVVREFSESLNEISGVSVSPTEEVRFKRSMASIEAVINDPDRVLTLLTAEMNNVERVVVRGRIFDDLVHAGRGTGVVKPWEVTLEAQKRYLGEIISTATDLLGAQGFAQHEAELLAVEQIANSYGVTQDTVRAIMTFERELPERLPNE